MALKFPSPTVCLSLAYIPLSLSLSYETSHHAVHLFFSSLLQRCCFFHSLPSPPCLLFVRPPHLLLFFPSAPFTTSTSPTLHDPHSNLPHLQPRAPSPTSPDEFPMNAKQAYKAFAAVPRSLAVLEPPQVGCAARTRPGHNNKACCADWLVSPHPLLTGAACAKQSQHRVGGSCDVL